MKTCAYCGRDNDDSAIACGGCGKAYKVSPTPEPEPQLVDPAFSPVIVGSFTSLQEAKLLADRLETAGIEAYIPEEFAPQIFSAVIPLELLTVRVAAKDYAAAREIIADDAEAAPGSTTQGPTELP